MYFQKERIWQMPSGPLYLHLSTSWSAAKWAVFFSPRGNYVFFSNFYLNKIIYICFFVHLNEKTERDLVKWVWAAEDLTNRAQPVESDGVCRGILRL